jgi:hypothetical protein
MINFDNDKEIFETASGILTGEINKIMGIRRINSLLFQSSITNENLIFDIKSIESQTDHIFIDNENLNSKSKERNEIELKDAESFFQKDIINISKKILQNYKNLLS